MAEHVTEFVRDGTLTTKWGATTKTRQAYELKIYDTADPYSKKAGGKFEDFIRGKRNLFGRFERDAAKRLDVKRHRVFVVMPIQGDEYGPQGDRNVYLEFTARFSAIEDVLDEFECVAIRIDREAPKPVIFLASKESVIQPGTQTRVHFDIHQNVQFFANHDELRKKLRDVIEKNRDKLLEPDTASSLDLVAAIR